MLFKAAQVIGMVGVMSASCFGQDIGLVYGEIGGWAYLQIMNGQDVDKIIALRLESSTSPINALWCWEDVNGVWQADAWETATWEEVAAYAFNYIGYEAGDTGVEDDLFLWPVELDLVYVTQELANPMEPQPFGDGLFIGDALEPVVESNPDVLQPLETIGYAAVATMSEISITQGTFGGVGIDPQPKDDECIALIDLLSALALAFESSDADLDTIDQVFIADYEANMAPGCSCPTRDWVVSASAWGGATCGAWSQTGSWAEINVCGYSWERTATESRTRTRAHTEPDPFTGTCIRQDCTQTQFRTGRQTLAILTPRPPAGGACPATSAPPPPATPCAGGGWQTGPWVPALCPWEL